MLKILQTAVVFAAGIFISGLIVRYGLNLAGRIDQYFLRKTNSSFGGFKWVVFLPTKIGKLFGFFQYKVIGEKNYFARISWPVKIASVIALLLFVAISSNKQTFIDYYTLTWFKETWPDFLVTSEMSIWFLHVITLAYLTLFSLILIESIRMYKFFAPIRFFIQIILSAFMSVLVIFSISVVIIVSIVYIILKIIGFFFFRKSDTDTEGRKGIRFEGFSEYMQQRSSFDPDTTFVSQPFYKEKKVRRKTKTKKKETFTESKTESTGPIDFDDDIGRIYPD